MQGKPRILGYFMQFAPANNLNKFSPQTMVFINLKFSLLYALW